MGPMATFRSSREPDGFPRALCPVPLTGAVVRYPEPERTSPPGGRLDDIGLGVVVDGRYASASEVLDLGRGRRRTVDLGDSLVLLGWLSPRALEGLRSAADTTDSGSSEEPGSPGLAFSLALRILERHGFGPLTRPVFLRIGFRDICRDLDPHESAAVRFLLGPRRVARSHLDYETGALEVLTSRSEPDPELEAALVGSFTGREVLRGGADPLAGTLRYRVRLPLPATLGETRSLLSEVRRGLGRLLARFESERYRAVGEMVAAFGVRETLGRFGSATGGPMFERVVDPAAGGSESTSWVH